MDDAAARAPLVVVCSGDEVLSGDLDAPPVPWWSVTKTCLAACALVLADQGRLKLDDGLLGRSYTLRHLLQHTSGLGSYTARPEYLAAVERDDVPWTDDEVLARVRLDPFLFQPGEGWSYSNTGYFLVRRLIEQTTGANIDIALRELVLAPLGIERTSIAREPSDLAVCAWGHECGYHPRWVFHGLLIGPPSDAVLFAHRLMAGALLSQAMLAAMCERRTLDVPLNGRPWRTAGYGLGTMIDVATPHGLCIGHSGHGPGSVAAVYHFPQCNPPRTVAAFAPVDDEAIVERLVLDRAGN